MNKVYITQHKELSSSNLKLVDYIHSPTYYHSVLSDNDLKAVNRGIKNKVQVLLDKLFEDAQFELNDEGNGVIFAAGNTNAAGTLTYLTKGRPDDYPEARNVALSVSNVLAGYSVNKLGRFEYMTTDATACISSASALTQGYNLIKSGQLKKVLIIACEDGSSIDLLEFFAKYKVSNTVLEDRGSFYLGEGASYILLEDQDTTNVITAEVLSAITYHEHYSNPLGISESGEGYKTIIKGSLSNANVKPNLIDYIKKHDTGTPDNEIESTIINDVFGDINTLSYKKEIGHTLGSNATIEMIKALHDTESQTTTLHIAAGMGNVFSGIITKNI